MRIGQVIGKLTLSQPHATFRGASLKIVVPLMLDELTEANRGDELQFQAEETLIAWDGVSVSEGAIVAIAEGPEASMPFRPLVKPVDAQIVALLDEIQIPRQF